MQIDGSSKTQSAFFDVNLFDLIAGQKIGVVVVVVVVVVAIPILTKNCNPFSLFSFINTPLSNDRIKIFIYSTYPILLQPPFLPTQPLLINHIFPWKSKQMRTGVDNACCCCFFLKTQGMKAFFLSVLWNQPNI